MKNLPLAICLLGLMLCSFLGAQNLDIDTTNTYAVVVGISDYQDELIPDLKYAHQDAEAFANFLRSPVGGALDEDHLKVLINEEATQGNLDAELDWLWDIAKENDRVIIYFSVTRVLFERLCQLRT